MTNTTIPTQEYKRLLSKSKAGWKMYYDLRDTYWSEIEEYCKDITILQEQSKDMPVMKEAIQRMLDGLKEQTKCCICLENDLDRHNSTIKTCLHRFHENCLKEYQQVSRNYKCPTCRQ